MRLRLDDFPKIGRPERPGEPSLPVQQTIRPARLEDAALAADLIHLSMGVEIDWLFGQEPGYPTHAVLQQLYRRKNNRLSHNFAYLTAWEGQAIGLLLAYPGRLLQRLDWLTGLHLLQIFGLGGTVRVGRRISAYGDLVETEVDEFYISNLAVLPGYQGRGAGKALMDYAETLALRAGLQKCSLIVTYGHTPARRLYEKLGYEIVCKYDILHPEVADGTGGYYRMVKVLSNA
jgi:ribosomal protein S18 acetylase RimI-like enzyme